MDQVSRIMAQAEQWNSLSPPPRPQMQRNEAKESFLATDAHSAEVRPKHCCVNGPEDAVGLADACGLRSTPIIL
eukprot:1917541-Amphidinium_carterae.1